MSVSTVWNHGRERYTSSFSEWFFRFALCCQSTVDTELFFYSGPFIQLDDCSLERCLCAREAQLGYDIRSIDGLICGCYRACHHVEEQRLIAVVLSFRVTRDTFLSILIHYHRSQKRRDAILLNYIKALVPSVLYDSNQHVLNIYSFSYSHLHSPTHSPHNLQKCISPPSSEPPLSHLHSSQHEVRIHLSQLSFRS